MARRTARTRPDSIAVPGAITGAADCDATDHRRTGGTTHHRAKVSGTGHRSPRAGSDLEEEEINRGLPQREPRSPRRPPWRRGLLRSRIRAASNSVPHGPITSHGRQDIAARWLAKDTTQAAANPKTTPHAKTASTLAACASSARTYETTRCSSWPVKSSASSGL